jgi:hypothetical protein
MDLTAIALASLCLLIGLLGGLMIAIRLASGTRRGTESNMTSADLDSVVELLSRLEQVRLKAHHHPKKRR